MKRVIRIVNWLMRKIIENNKGYAVIHITCRSSGEFKIYLDSQPMATISPEGCMFNFPLTNEQIAELYEITKGDERK